MEFNIVSLGNKPPSWIDTGIKEYQGRLRRPWQLKFINLESSVKKKKSTKLSLIEQEGMAILEAIPKNSALVCLDEKGKNLTTYDLAEKVNKLSLQYSKFTFVIGGADGLDRSCLEKSDLVWSLSNLTLPHQMVKLMVTEQIYRLWSLDNNHPYHRS